MITFQEEHYSRMFNPEYKELYEIHWNETGGFNRDTVKLAVDWETYRALGKNGSLVVFSARDDDKLIGYSKYFLVRHPHYRHTVIADHDVLYLHPDYRKGMTGYKFIKFCRDNLKDRANIIILTMKAQKEHNFFKIAERLGFKLMDYKFTMEV